MRVLLPTEGSSCTQRRTPSSPTTKPLASLLRTLPPECQDFCTTGRPLSTVQQSFPSARRRPAHAPKRPEAAARPVLSPDDRLYCRLSCVPEAVVHPADLVL